MWQDHAVTLMAPRYSVLRPSRNPTQMPAQPCTVCPIGPSTNHSLAPPALPAPSASPACSLRPPSLPIPRAYPSPQSHQSRCSLHMAFQRNHPSWLNGLHCQLNRVLHRPTPHSPKPYHATMSGVTQRDPPAFLGYPMQPWLSLYL